ncbi:MBL fold metallo-hydrolase [Vibrio mediterranei]|uniref:MBL fold metallo-hydrolase n=1 Tax=Vibrio mediterranei TaxID=689 RepID=UPI0040680B32
MQLTHNVAVFHHGGKRTVTGSCHELRIGDESILIDCGLHQGSDARQRDVALPFDLQRIQGIVLTHAHIDHIGRIPWLMAAGYRGPIYCTPATAYLVPLMLFDALKLQSGLRSAQIETWIELVSQYLRPIAYGTWVPIKSCRNDYFSYVRLNPAGHILGSAYAEFKLPNHEIVVFSGDLGPSHTPLLPDPASPQRADYLFLESTYGDKQHESIAQRSERLLTIINRSLKDGGAIIVPAFSVGRTQELLFDIESLLHQQKLTSRLPIIIDSPMAAKVTKAYRHYRKLWAQDAQQKLRGGRKPLNFSQCIVVESHREHCRVVNRLASTGEAAIVVSASGMCQGGRVMDYLQALLPDKRTDILFCGYQAEGTLGRDIQQGQDVVWMDGKTIKINASVHSLSGYSAHADQRDLIKFVEGCQTPLKQLHLIHGEDNARQELAARFKVLYPSCDVVA